MGRTYWRHRRASAFLTRRMRVFFTYSGLYESLKSMIKKRGETMFDPAIRVVAQTIRHRLWAEASGTMWW